MPPSNSESEEKIAIIDRHHNEGISIVAMSKELNIPQTTLYSWLNDPRYNKRLEKAIAESISNYKMEYDICKLKLEGLKLCNESQNEKRKDEIIKMAVSSLNKVIEYYIK